MQVLGRLVTAARGRGDPAMSLHSYFASSVGAKRTIHETSLPADAKLILDNVCSKYGKKGTFKRMPDKPESWYIIVKTLFTMEKDVFSREWDAQPAEFKEIPGMGKENRKSKFLRRGAGEFYVYSGMKNKAFDLTAGSTAERFLDLTNSLLQPTTKVCVRVCRCVCRCVFVCVCVCVCVCV